jgi:uncharacterized protein YkwD
LELPVKLPVKFLPALCLALGLGAALPALADCLRPADASTRVAQALAEVNSYRASAGLPGLSTDRKLEKTAENHACDMARMGHYSHIGSNGSELVDRLKAQNYRYRAANENVGQFRPSTSAAGWWFNSPGHKANMLSPKIKSVGFGVAVGADQKHYWVMVGGKSK